VDGIELRAPQREGAAAFARIHLQNTRYYAALDGDVSQVPDEDGLIEWFEALW
jgi:hypothetical protein